MWNSMRFLLMLSNLGSKKLFVQPKYSVICLKSFVFWLNSSSIVYLHVFSHVRNAVISLSWFLDISWFVNFKQISGASVTEANCASVCENANDFHEGFTCVATGNVPYPWAV